MIPDFSQRLYHHFSPFHHLITALRIRVIDYLRCSINIMIFFCQIIDTGRIFSNYLLPHRCLTQQSWIRALDNKFSLLKAQKIYYKALTCGRWNRLAQGLGHLVNIALGSVMLLAIGQGPAGNLLSLGAGG
jgi:hypothetical protein